MAILSQIRLPQRDLVFPWDRAQNYLWKVYGKIRKKAGLPAGRRDSFHRLRRSVASHMEAAGGNATDQLRHSGRRVTEAYLDPRIVVKQQAIDFLFRPDVDDEEKGDSN